jgi:hypothetical protein
MPERAPVASRARGWVWAQLLIGWLPVLALYAAMIVLVHGVSAASALHAALRSVGIAALLGLGVMRFTDRLPWPRPVRATFVLAHTAGALFFSAAWVAGVTLVESLMRGHFFMATPPGAGPFLLVGIWLYIAVAGVTYAVRATEYAARARLLALRSQLNPHFLFNALHTVVQLIPLEPSRAANAAERLAEMLRTSIDEDRDEVPLREEWKFVERYLALEALRFDDRLVVTSDLAADTLDALVPPFVVQTLVENAVRHGASPRVEATHVHVAAALNTGTLVITVSDDGAGAEESAIRSSRGTGLARLREQLSALHGRAASLEISTAPGTGFRATVRVPHPGHTA